MQRKGDANINQILLLLEEVNCVTDETGFELQPPPGSQQMQKKLR